MRGDPGAATFVRNGLDEPHVFVRGNDNRLYLYFFDTRRGFWRISDLGLPPGTSVGGSPAAVVARTDHPVTHRALAHLLGAGGRPFENKAAPEPAAWVGLGVPNNAQLASTPSGVAFRRQGGSTEDEVAIFAWGLGDDLLYRFIPPDGWRVAAPDPALPFRVMSPPAAVFHRGDVYASVVGTTETDGQLFTHHSTNLATGEWSWRAAGPPSATVSITWNIRPAVVSFWDQHIAFVRGSDGGLWAHYFGNANEVGTWVPLGTPSGTTAAGHPTVVPYRLGNQWFLYVFVRGADRRLHVYRWDGTNAPVIVPMGRPTTNGGDVLVGGGTGGTSDVASAPLAITARFEGRPRIYAFVRGADGHLHVCYWNNSVWSWTDLDGVSTPPARLDFAPSSVNFGSVTVEATASRTVTITNISGVPTSVTVAPPTIGDPFLWSPATATLAPGATLPVTVEFTPSEAGLRTARLTVTSDSAGSPHRVPLRGNGLGPNRDPADRAYAVNDARS